MFWNAVLNGLKVLLHWQTYVVAIMYFIISYLPIILMAIKGDKLNNLKGVYLIMLTRPFFQALAVFVSVCTLFPIMLGSSDATWPLPWMLLITMPLRVLILLVIMVIFSFIGAFIPILGRANSFIMFIMGGVILVFLTLVINTIRPELGIRNIEIIPGFLTIIGIVIVSGITSWLGILVSAAIMTLIFRDKEEISHMFIMPLAAVFGFIPIFIYGAWLGLQISALNK